jgi:hypothetical protein
MEVAGGAERARRLGFADVTEMRQHKWRFKARVECDTALRDFAMRFVRLIRVLGIARGRIDSSSSSVNCHG